MKKYILVLTLIVFVLAMTVAQASDDNMLVLKSVDNAATIYVQTNANFDLELWQEEMSEEVAGYQTFLEFDSDMLSIEADNITLTGTPFGLPIRKVVVDDYINLAAGLNPMSDPAQSPTDADAKLGTLTFKAGTTEGTTQVVFRDNNPPTRFTTINGVADEALTVDGPFIVIAGTKPTGTIKINNDATYTASTSVTLTLDASDALSGLASMRFSNDETTWSAWEPYATSASWTLASVDGLKTVYVQFMDKAGNVSDAVSDTITLDMVAPSGTIVINSDADYTNSKAVTLTLNASDTTSGMDEMQFSNDDNTWSEWEEYAASKSWNLDDTEDGL
ncbi:MAG: hypothetical protein GX811_12185, partial [Lentisphaerae bacterium]|nr:hypothetical protein [Lentisphaerota bacterium]